MAARGTFDFSRHHEAAVRVYLQHWMIKHHLGFLIHPAIDLRDKSDVKVMDIACGTGIWLVDVASQLPKSAQLDGCDISPAHFPPEGELPSNVNLVIHDACNPFPTKLHSKYDIVHVGRVSMYVHNENPRPMLDNIVQLLKPGGYLQWDDLDVCGIYIQRPDDMTHNHSTDVWRHYAIGFFQNMGCGSDWLDELPQHFQSHGVNSLDSERVKIQPGYAKPWTSMQLMANRDFTMHDIIPATAGEPGWPTAQEWEEILDGVERECARGVRPLMDITYTVGRKESRLEPAFRGRNLDLLVLIKRERLAIKSTADHSNHKYPMPTPYWLLYLLIILTILLSLLLVKAQRPFWFAL